MKSRSLFWTFAGVFLLVLAVATALQVFVSVGVLRPLAQQNARQQAELRVEQVSREIAALPDASQPRDIIPVLRADTPDGRAEILVFCMHDGPVVPDRRLAVPVHVGIVALLLKQGLADSTMAQQPLPPPPNGPDGGPPAGEFGQGPPGDVPPGERRPGDGPPRDRRPGDGPPRDRRPGEGPPRDRRPGEGLPPDGPQRGPAAGPRRDNAAAKFEVLAHRAVVRDGESLGELVMVGPQAGQAPWSVPGSRAMLLFLPLAVLVSGAAALLMVRLLVRRLRALELVANRVTEGDLGARVEEHGLDEIGRLEERFNRMTDRLAAARTQLEETDRQRRTLLADITHELATPLTSIRGYVETLLDPAVQTSAEERTGYLNDVLDEAKRLDLMISELFELARLEAGATPLKPVRLDWNALCRNTARRLEPRFRGAGLELINTGATEPLWVRADGRRLEQVVENLLLNALRYVPSPGHVWLDVDRVPADTTAARAGEAASAGAPLRLTVSDDGPGIAAADLPHVFERFYRAETVRAMGGTGLGLAIVREIVRQHGGDIRAEQRTPRGAMFVVELVGDEG